MTDQETKAEAEVGETEFRRNTSLHALDSLSPKWNDPQVNFWRTLTCFLGLLIMGANDAAFGV